MRVTMLWYGGTSYAAPSNEHAESFPSLRAAVRACRDREDNRDGRTPCVEYNRDDSTAAWVFFGPVGDYPDRLIERGPRGGYRVTRC